MNIKTEARDYLKELTRCFARNFLSRGPVSRCLSETNVSAVVKMLVPTKKSVFGERVRRSATSSSRETAAGSGGGSSGVHSLSGGGGASGSAVQLNSELLEKIDIKMEFAPMKRQVKELCPELSEIEKDGLHMLYAVLVHFNQRFVRHVSHSAHNEQVRILTLEWQGAGSIRPHTLVA